MLTFTDESSTVNSPSNELNEENIFKEYLLLDSKTFLNLVHYLLYLLTEYCFLH